MISASSRFPLRHLLLLHGTEDTVLPPACSQHVYETAKEPKDLILLKKAGHVLDEVHEEVRWILMSWIPGKLDGTGEDRGKIDKR